MQSDNTDHVPARCEACASSQDSPTTHRLEVTYPDRTVTYGYCRFHVFQEEAMARRDGTPARILAY